MLTDVQAYCTEELFIVKYSIIILIFDGKLKLEISDTYIN